MFSLIALYFAYRRGAVVPVVTTGAAMPAVAVNDRNPAPIARAA